MSWALANSESLRSGTRRIFRRQIDEALALLCDLDNGPNDEAVHEVRRAFKRLRSLLRLAQFAMGKRAFRAEDEVLRSAGQLLAESRDRKVLLEAIDRLRGSNLTVAEESLLSSLSAEASALTAGAQHSMQRVSREVRTLLEDSIDRLPAWTKRRYRRRDLLRGLRKTYRGGRKALRDVSLSAMSERLHAWRKEVKYLRHQLEILDGPRRGGAGKIIAKAERLGEFLGEDHDLAMLQQHLERHAAANGNTDHSQSLQSMITRRRSEIQTAALDAGKRLYGDRPRRFIKRIEASGAILGE